MEKCRKRAQFPAVQILQHFIVIVDLTSPALYSSHTLLLLLLLTLFIITIIFIYYYYDYLTVQILLWQKYTFLDTKNNL